MTSLFLPGETGLRQASLSWLETKDCDPHGLAIFRRHYSCENYDPNNIRFAGPGEKVVLISPNADALFIWRKETFRRDTQIGVNCAVFRNEGDVVSSTLILEAMEIAWQKWPCHRLFTFVNPRKVSSSNPGFCFLMAGWQKCGRTQEDDLLILEVLP